MFRHGFRRDVTWQQQRARITALSATEGSEVDATLALSDQEEFMLLCLGTRSDIVCH